MYKLSEEQLRSLWVEAWVEAEMFNFNNISRQSYREEAFQKYIKNNFSNNLEEEEEMFNKPKFIVYSDAVNVMNQDTEQKQDIQNEEDQNDTESNQSVVQEEGKE